MGIADAIKGMAEKINGKISEVDEARQWNEVQKKFSYLGNNREDMTIQELYGPESLVLGFDEQKRYSLLSKWIKGGKLSGEDAGKLYEHLTNYALPENAGNFRKLAAKKIEGYLKTNFPGTLNPVPEGSHEITVDDFAQGDNYFPGDRSLDRKLVNAIREKYEDVKRSAEKHPYAAAAVAAPFAVLLSLKAIENISSSADGQTLENMVSNAPAFVMENAAGLVLSGGIVNQALQAKDGDTVKVYANGRTTPWVDVAKNGGRWNASDIPTPVEDDGRNVPEKYEVSNAFPNPFNPHSNVRVMMPGSGHVKGVLYDGVGREVKTIIDKEYTPGTHDIGITLDKLAGGVYYARFVITNDEGVAYQQVRKLAFVPGFHSQAVTPSGLIVPQSSVPSLKKTAAASVDSIVVSGDNIVAKTFTNPAWQNLGDGTYDVGNLQVDQINRLIVGPVYDLDTKFDAGGKKTLEGLLVFLGSNPDFRMATDSNGMAILYTTKMGRDSVFVIDTTATDTTGVYNWKHPELNIAKGENAVKHFQDDFGIPTKHRGKDEHGQDFLDFTKFITYVDSLWKNDPVYKQTVPRFNTEELPNNELKIYFNRDKLPEMIYFFRNTTPDSIKSKDYVDSLLAGAKKKDRPQQKFVETLDSLDAQIEVRYTNMNTANVVQFLYEFNNDKGPHLSRIAINTRGPPNNGFLPPEILSYIMAHETQRAAFGFRLDSPYISDLIYKGVGERYYLAGIRNYGSKKELWAEDFILHLNRNSTKLNYWFK